MLPGHVGLTLDRVIMTGTSAHRPDKAGGFLNARKNHRVTSSEHNSSYCLFLASWTIRATAKGETAKWIFFGKLCKQIILEKSRTTQKPDVFNHSKVFSHIKFSAHILPFTSGCLSIGKKRKLPYK